MYQNYPLALSQISRLDPSIIQILTGMVMKYYVSVDCQESYIFPRDYIFPEVCSTEGKYNYLGTIGTWYFIRPGRYLLY